MAGVDMAGEAEEGEGATLRAHKPRQDSTVVTIGEADFSDTSAWQPWPLVRVVEHYWWTGVPHANLAPQLLAVLKEQWRCQRVAIDATGVGEGVASLLKAALGERVVRPLRFTAPVKSQLGFDLLAAANAGRLRLYADDGSLEARQCRWELAHARLLLPAQPDPRLRCGPIGGTRRFPDEPGVGLGRGDGGGAPAGARASWLSVRGGEEMNPAFVFARSGATKQSLFFNSAPLFIRRLLRFARKDRNSVGLEN